MKLNFLFNPDIYDFWKIYDAVKQYYPIGIDRGHGEGIYFDYPGIKKLEKILVDNIHDSQMYKEQWVDFTEKLAKELHLENVGTTFGQAPSYSSSLILERSRVNDCLYTKELHFSVSLIGDFFQIYGLDSTRVFEKDGQRGYSAVNAVTTSPFQEYGKPFEYVRNRLEEKYPNHLIVPYGIGRTIINGLQVHYLDNETCCVNTALFNQFLNVEDVQGSIRGDMYYGIEKWQKKDI
ncbi:MAG: hypothetical protein AAFU57_17850 [Bacteroidota bacterium]